MREINIWRIFAFIITEDDIEHALAAMPDDGMGANERAEKLRKIEKKIAELKGTLNKELEELKRQ